MTDAGETDPSVRFLAHRVEAFCSDRDWGQFHNTKDLAISLALEAAEVLELTQWKGISELESNQELRVRLAEELSDVLYWVLVLASRHGIDLADAFERKMVENERKYPANKARGSSAKYTEL